MIMTPTESKSRTITLTGRGPVKINTDDWPILAQASGDSYEGHDYGRHQQALNQGECDTYHLTVRQHTDGRTLVYGVFDTASAWTHNETHRGGLLITPPEIDFAIKGGWIWNGRIDDQPVTLTMWPGIAVAIRMVGEECGLPDAIIRACIADLPAEEL